MRFRLIRVCSSAWLERTPDKGEVGSSSLPRPTNFKYQKLPGKPLNIGFLGVIFFMTPPLMMSCNL